MMEMSVTQPLKGYFQTRYLENQATSFIKIMELLQPGGVLERFDYAKLPRIAQYEVIKEVLWVAYQDTWRQTDSIPNSKSIRKSYRKTMKFAIKNLLDHLGLSTRIPPKPPHYKRSQAPPPPPPSKVKLGAGFGGMSRRHVAKQPVRSTVDIILPSIQEEPTSLSSFKKMPKTSLFFRPSKRLAHIHETIEAERRLERIKIAAGLGSRDHTIQRGGGQWNAHLDSSTGSSRKYHGVRLPQLNGFKPNNKYGSSHYSVFDPLGQLNPVDMNLQARIGRPELSPEIGFRSGPDGFLSKEHYSRVESKLRKKHYQQLSAEEKKIFKEKMRQKRLERIARGEIVSSESDLSEEVSDIDDADYEKFVHQKQAERAKKAMLRASNGGVPGEDGFESDSSDYWKEKPGNLPLDMQRNEGKAQILLPGFDLQDISLPKDAEEKKQMLKMYNEAVKMALMDGDFDMEEDPDFTDDIMDKIESGEMDLEEYLAQGNFTEEEKEAKRKKLKQYKQLKEMAKAMGPGVTVADMRKNVKRILQQANPNDIVFDEHGNVTLANNLVEKTMSRIKNGELPNAADMIDIEKKKKKLQKQIKRAEKEAKKARKNEKKAKRAEKLARIARGEVVSSDSSSSEEEIDESKLNPEERAKYQQKKAKKAAQKAKRAERKEKLKARFERRDARKAKNEERARRRAAGEEGVSSDEMDTDPDDESSLYATTESSSSSAISSDSSDSDDDSYSGGTKKSKKKKKKKRGSESDSGESFYAEVSEYESSVATVYGSDGEILEAHKPRVRKVVTKKFKAKVTYESSEASVYDDDGNLIKAHKPRRKVIQQQMYDDDGNLVILDEPNLSVLQQMASKMAAEAGEGDEEIVIGKDGEIIKKSEAIFDKHGNVIGKKPDRQRNGSTLSRKNSNLANRPPWRAGAPSAEARSRALSRTSTYIDEQGNKITSKMIRERNKSRKGGRRSSTFVAPDIKGPSREPTAEFDWSQYDLPKPKTSAEIEEEIRQLELAGDFEAGARLRQQLRDVRRAERKAAEVAAEQAQADAEQEKADRLFNKNARREQMADLKGRIARERREAQLRAERKAAERRAMLAACTTEEERQALLAKWEAERLAEEAEIERLRKLAAEQRAIQLRLLKKQFKLRKKLKMWRDIQLADFGMRQTQSINRPFIYSHIPGPIPAHSLA